MGLRELCYSSGFLSIMPLINYYTYKHFNFENDVFYSTSNLNLTASAGGFLTRNFVIKENYFPAEGSVAPEGTTNDDSETEVLTEEEAKEVVETADMSDTMKWYSTAISRSIKK